MNTEPEKNEHENSEVMEVFTDEMISQVKVQFEVSVKRIERI